MMKNKETEKEENSEDIEEEPNEAEEEPEEEQEPAQFDDSEFFQQMSSVDFISPVLEKVVTSPQQLANLEESLSSITTSGEKSAEDELRYSSSSSEYQPETPEIAEPRNIVLTPIETEPIGPVRNIFREFRGIDLINPELQELGGGDEEEKYVHSEIIERDERLPFQRGSEKKYKEFRR